MATVLPEAPPRSGRSLPHTGSGTSSKASGGANAHYHTASTLRHLTTVHRLLVFYGQEPSSPGMRCTPNMVTATRIFQVLNFVGNFAFLNVRSLRGSAAAQFTTLFYPIYVIVYFVSAVTFLFGLYFFSQSSLAIDRLVRIACLQPNDNLHVRKYARNVGRLTVAYIVVFTLIWISVNFVSLADLTHNTTGQVLTVEYIWYATRFADVLSVAVIYVVVAFYYLMCEMLRVGFERIRTEDTYSHEDHVMLNTIHVTFTGQWRPWMVVQPFMIFLLFLTAVASALQTAVSTQTFPIADTFFRFFQGVLPIFIIFPMLYAKRRANKARLACNKDRDGGIKSAAKNAHASNRETRAGRSPTQHHRSVGHGASLYMVHEEGSDSASDSQHDRDNAPELLLTIGSTGTSSHGDASPMLPKAIPGNIVPTPSVPVLGISAPASMGVHVPPQRNRYMLRRNTMVTAPPPRDPEESLEATITTEARTPMVFQEPEERGHPTTAAADDERRHTALQNAARSSGRNSRTGGGLRDDRSEDFERSRCSTDDERPAPRHHSSDSA